MRSRSLAVTLWAAATIYTAAKQVLILMANPLQGPLCLETSPNREDALR